MSDNTKCQCCGEILDVKPIPCPDCGGAGEAPQSREAVKPTTVLEVLRKYLVDNHLDGLVNLEMDCACGVEHLFGSCQCGPEECQVAVRVKCTERCEHDEPGDGFHFEPAVTDIPKLDCPSCGEPLIPASGRGLYDSDGEYVEHRDGCRCPGAEEVLAALRARGELLRYLRELMHKYRLLATEARDRAGGKFLDPSHAQDKLESYCHYHALRAIASVIDFVEVERP